MAPLSQIIKLARSPLDNFFKQSLLVIEVSL